MFLWSSVGVTASRNSVALGLTPLTANRPGESHVQGGVPCWYKVFWPASDYKVYNSEEKKGRDSEAVMLFLIS